MKPKIIAAALAVASTAFLTSCGGGNSNTTPADSVQTADTKAASAIQKRAESNVDWEHPLLTVNDKGDTLEIWTYNDKGLVIQHNCNYDLKDENSYKYDDQGRMVWHYSITYSGNNHESEYKYAYKGNLRIGEGSEMAEGWQSYFDVKELAYYLDPECKYDTLTQTYEMEIPWDESDKVHDHDVTNQPPTSYTTTTYKKSGDKYLPVEQKCYRRDFDDTSKTVLSFRFVYEYNSNGLITKETDYDSNQNLSATITYEYNSDGLVVKKTHKYGNQESVTTYSYNDNVQTEVNSEDTFKTYYKKKK